MKRVARVVGLAGVAVAIVATMYLALPSLRYDVALQADGSSAIRDRLTGEVKVCGSENRCTTRPVRRYVCQDNGVCYDIVPKRDEWLSTSKWIGSIWKPAPSIPARRSPSADNGFVDRIFDETVAQLNNESRARSIAIRSQKGLPEKIIDLIAAAGAGMAMPFVDLSDTLVGEPIFEDKQGWKGLWGLRTEVEFGLIELRRQSTYNSVAANFGYGIPIAIGLTIVALISIKKIRRSQNRASPSGT